MKILHIVNTISEGGVCSILSSLLPALKNVGCHVDLLVLDKNIEVEIQDVTTHQGKYANIYDLRNILLIRSYIKRGRYDIIHSHLFPTQYFCAIAKVITKSTAKYITTEHGSHNKRRDYAVFRLVEKLIYKRYDSVIACSNDAYVKLKAWLQLNSNQSKITTITNGINLNKFNISTRARLDLCLPADAKILIMVARFFDAKDHKTVIRVLTLLNSSIHILFCGSGEEGITECRLLSQKLCVDERVHFLGGRADIPNLLKNSAIGILSSFNEGLPISILEYMAAGLPVVCTDVDGSRELVQNYGVLFPVGDYEYLAKEITKLLENKEYYDNVATKCYNRGREFSEEIMIQKYINLYQELLCKTI